MSSTPPEFVPFLCIVGFHHARGPEIESWIGDEDGPSHEAEWPLLPFLALSDGAHSTVEEFSYFTLPKQASNDQPATSLFGISCTRQIDASTLINRPADVTRSTVQKAVVLICNRPQQFSYFRERLSVVTKAWFAQKDFTDTKILTDFQESLSRNYNAKDAEKEQFFGLSLREMIHEFKHNVLVLFKCLLLQPKMLFFGSNCERLCMMQFSLISLIPGLIQKLQDCADPAFHSLQENMVMPTSLKTSERASLLAYFGLPLNLFGKGSFFGPYTPLQHLDMLSDQNTKSYVVGSTNSLLLSQNQKYSDVLINLDETSVVIESQKLSRALTLTIPDRRWIDALTQTVQETWDEENPGRPKTLGYMGSEEFIRLQFEEYLLALLSATKLHLYQASRPSEQKSILLDSESADPISDYGTEWVKEFMVTENFQIFNKYTDSHIFDIVDASHPCTGALTMEDVQRRLVSQVAELHLDEKFQQSRETLGKHLASGQKKVAGAFSAVWVEIEAMREAQKRKAELKDKEKESLGSTKDPQSPNPSLKSPEDSSSPPMKWPTSQDLTAAQASASATMAAASQKAGAYFSSWGAWAAEKRRSGWNNNATSGQQQQQFDQGLPNAAVSNPSAQVAALETAIAEGQWGALGEGRGGKAEVGGEGEENGARKEKTREKEASVAGVVPVVGLGIEKSVDVKAWEEEEGGKKA